MDVILKNKIRIILLFISLAGCHTLADEWVTAKYAGAFFETGVGARPMSMGGAFVAVTEDVSSLYWNPAGLAFLKNYQLHGMHSERFSGIINWDFIGLGIPLINNTSLGFGYFRLGVDGIPITRLLDPNLDPGDFYIDDEGNRIQNIPIAERYVDDTESAFVFTFAKKSSAKFSWGGNVKVISKKTGSHSAWGIGFDVGLFWNPYKNLKVGAVLVDGTSTLVAWNSGRKELIVPHCKLGFAYPFEYSDFSFLPVFDFTVRFDNPGSASQLALGRWGMDFFYGCEIGYKRGIFIRIGNQRGDFTAGTGLRYSFLQVDYGYSSHIELGHSHRISLTLHWKKGLSISF